MRALYIEPFNAGSHAAFTRTLTEGVDADWTVLTLPGRHWKWRMRGSAAYFAREESGLLARGYDVLFASSYLPLAELVGLCPALTRVPRILYFHENQLAFPVREDRERDLHYGFTQIMSALAADRCLFNSRYNLESFLEAGEKLLSSMPDARPGGIISSLRERSEVLSFPLALPGSPAAVARPAKGAGPIILWNHRWEHDKNPDAFFSALKALVDRGAAFRVAVCGHRFRQEPAVFEEARRWLGERVVHWGTCETRAEYEALLGTCDIAVSTAVHEFFGVAALEATHFGCFPLVPDRLAYPELFPEEYRYSSDGALVDRLVALCEESTESVASLRADRRHITAPHLAPAILPRCEAVMREVATSRRP